MAASIVDKLRPAKPATNQSLSPETPSRWIAKAKSLPTPNTWSKSPAPDPTNTFRAEPNVQALIAEMERR